MFNFLNLFGIAYRAVARPIFFRLDTERVHDQITRLGEHCGACVPLRTACAKILKQAYPRLQQTWNGITFTSPFGLAAGFDYEARLTYFISPLGFGFQTIGTITNDPYGGNARPQLGRLVSSRALLVNKGFRNPGIDAVLQKLSTKTFISPVGLSIGQTNTPSITTLEGAIQDIINTFKKTVESNLDFAYFELNISCPNLNSPVSFAQAEALESLLEAIDSLQLSRPLFIKFPISVTDAKARELLSVISCHQVQGVIIGNLQKDRQHPTINQKEVARFPQGNFSGLPTQQRSDELIRLARQVLPESLLIIGCGGVFNAEDAYRKIRAGASLIQLITGLIYEGPQLVAAMNADLDKLLKRDGYEHLSEAIGVDVKPVI